MSTFIGIKNNNRLMFNREALNFSNAQLVDEINKVGNRLRLLGRWFSTDDTMYGIQITDDTEMLADSAINISGEVITCDGIVEYPRCIEHLTILPVPDKNLEVLNIDAETYTFDRNINNIRYRSISIYPEYDAEGFDICLKSSVNCSLNIVSDDVKLVNLSVTGRKGIINILKLFSPEGITISKCENTIISCGRHNEQFRLNANANGTFKVNKEQADRFVSIIQRLLTDTTLYDNEGKDTGEKLGDIEIDRIHVASFWDGHIHFKDKIGMITHMPIIDSYRVGTDKDMVDLLLELQGNVEGPLRKI